MEFKMISLLVLGISSLSEAQECAAWGDSCGDVDSSVDPCCGGSTCSPGVWGGWCKVDNTCIPGGYKCIDPEHSSGLGFCCQGYSCVTEKLGPMVGYCMTEKYYESIDWDAALAEFDAEN